LILVALANLMRLSLTERRTRNRVQCSVAGNPGRDDKGESRQRGEWRLQSLRLGPRRLLPRQQVCFVSSVTNFHSEGADMWYL
jgi:hypothetical protein